MKSFLKVLLTLWMTGLFFLLSVVVCFKGIAIDTTDQMVKNELKKSIRESVKDEVTEDTLKKIEKRIDDNKDVKELMDKYMTQFIENVGSGEKTQIDMTKDFESLINFGEDLLKDFDIEIDEKTKEELLSPEVAKKFNDELNNTLDEINQDIGTDQKRAIQIFAFITSSKFKMILIGLIGIALLLIALLNKNFYSWLKNLGVASIITGFILVLFIPMIAKLIAEAGSDIEIKTATGTTFGTALLIIGIISFILHFIIVKFKKEKKEKEPEGAIL